MSLTSAAAVESTGALTPQLFNFTGAGAQAQLDAFVQDAIDYAQAWMQGHMPGGTYGLTDPPWAAVLQERGERFLALEAICDTLRQEKVLGEHYDYIAENSDAFNGLLENDWGLRATQALDRWVTIEKTSSGFALPLLVTSSPIPEDDCNNNGRDPLEVLYSRLLDRARGIANPSIGTVTR